MNSIMMKENCTKYFKGLDKPTARKLLQHAAHYTEASKILISYRAGAGEKLCQYGICQQEKTNLFIHRKEKAFAKNWEEAHPGMECISLQHTCNSRGSTSSLLFGFGLDYVEHAKYFITYRKPISVA